MKFGVKLDIPNKSITFENVLNNLKPHTKSKIPNYLFKIIAIFL